MPLPGLFRNLLQAGNMVKSGGFPATPASIMARQKTAASNQKVSKVKKLTMKHWLWIRQR
jgi:hypothetical protein